MAVYLIYFYSKRFRYAPSFNYQLSYSPYSNYLVGLTIYHPTVFPLYNCILVKGQIMNISSQLSRLDSFLSYIHRPQWKTSLVQAVEPAQLYAPLPVAGTTQFAHVETSIPPTTYTIFSMLLPSSNS